MLKKLNKKNYFMLKKLIKKNIFEKKLTKIFLTQKNIKKYKK